MTTAREPLPTHAPAGVGPQRGSILDRNYKTLAISIGADAVYAIPARVGDPDQTAQKLAPYLSLPTSELASKLRSDSQQSVWLARKLDPTTAQAIRNLKLPGIYLVQRPQRYYPNGTLAAHILGLQGLIIKASKVWSISMMNTSEALPGCFLPKRMPRAE